VIVVLADHGEGLGDHQNRPRCPHLSVDDEGAMIVAGPGVPAARAVTMRVATIDVLPTAMRLLGFDYDTRLSAAICGR